MPREDPNTQPSPHVFHTKHEWGVAEPLSYTLITAVSALTGTEPTSLPPLTRIVQCDAVNTLFAETGAGGRSTDYLRLTYAGCTIFVHRNGHIIIDPPTFP